MEYDFLPICRGMRNLTTDAETEPVGAWFP
jgi:hypothetical protein